MKKQDLVTGTIFAGLIGYAITLVPLNLIVATDYPHEPGDGYRNLVKVISAALVGWLCARDWYRHQIRKADRKDDSPTDRRS